MGIWAAIHLSVPLLATLIGGCITFAAALGGIAGFHAYKSAASGWKEERDAAVSKSDRLEHDLEILKNKLAQLQSEVDALRAKDVSKLYDLMTEHHKEMVAGARALQERDAELLAIVKALALQAGR